MCVDRDTNGRLRVHLYRATEHVECHPASIGTTPLLARAGCRPASAGRENKSARINRSDAVFAVVVDMY